MDNGLNIDELFGENDALSLSGPPIANGLVQRIDELRTLGFRQRIAWSRLGCVASITEDGQGVIIRSFLCNAEDGSWDLSRPRPLSHINLVHEGQQLIYLSWNPLGTELATVDALGRISIFTMAIAINRLNPTRPGTSDQEDDLGAIVYLTWLNPERQFPLYCPSTRGSGHASYGVTMHKLSGPYHPLNRSALVCVTRNGFLRMLFQQIDGRFAEARTELDSLNSSKDALTHASMCSYQDNALLLLVRSLARKHRLYRISINWNLPARQPAPGQPQTPLNPVITVKPIKLALSVLEDVDIPPGMTDIVSQPPPQLSHLELLPITPHSKHIQPTVPTILMVLSQVPTSESQGYQESLSYLVRWELKSMHQKLHPSFDQLSSKVKSTNSHSLQNCHLNRLDDIVVDKVLLAVHQVAAGTVIVAIYSDGTIQFRDRATMAIITFDETNETISSLPQTGFEFSDEEHCLHVALSPNWCLALTLDGDSNSKLKTLRYALGEIDASEADSKFEKVILALAAHLAFSCTHSISNDDILALIRKLNNPAVERGVLSEVYRAMSLAVDYSSDAQHEKLWRNANLQKCLSIQDSLGYRGERMPRSLTAKVAWVTLQLRLISMTITQSFNNGTRTGAGQPTDSDLSKPEVLQFFLGLIRWCVDLMNFMADELFETANILKGRFNDVLLVNQTIVTLSTCALPILFSSLPRAILRQTLRGLRLFGSIATLGLQTPSPGNPQRQYYSTILSSMESSAVRVTLFDRLLSDLDGSIRSTYGASAISDADRALVEKDMLVGAALPGVLAPALEHFFARSLPQLRQELDPAAMYFADYSWLALADDRRTMVFRRRHVVDAMRKVVMPVGRDERGRVVRAVRSAGAGAGPEDAKGSLLRTPLPLRRCTRCASYTEDTNPWKGSNITIATLQRMCLCGGLWHVVY